MGINAAQTQGRAQSGLDFYANEISKLATYSLHVKQAAAERIVLPENVKQAINGLQTAYQNNISSAQKLLALMQRGGMPAEDMRRASALLNSFIEASRSALFMQFDVLVPYVPKGLESATTGKKTTGNEHIKFVSGLYRERVVSGEFLKDFFSWNADTQRDNAHALYEGNGKFASSSALQKVDGAFAIALTSAMEFEPHAETGAKVSAWIKNCFGRLEGLSAECMRFEMRLEENAQHEQNNGVQVQFGDMNIGKGIKLGISLLPIGSEGRQRLRERVDGLEVGSVAGWENAADVNKTVQMFSVMGIGRAGGPVGAIFEKLYFSRDAVEQVKAGDALGGALFLAALWSGPLGKIMSGTSAASKIAVAGIGLAGTAGGAYMTVGLAQGLAFSVEDVQDFGFSVKGAAALVEQGVFAAVAVKGAAEGRKKAAVKKVVLEKRIADAARRDAMKVEPAPAIGKREPAGMKDEVETDAALGRKKAGIEKEFAPVSAAEKGEVAQGKKADKDAAAHEKEGEETLASEYAVYNMKYVIDSFRKAGITDAEIARRIELRANEFEERGSHVTNMWIEIARLLEGIDPKRAAGIYEKAGGPYLESAAELLKDTAPEKAAALYEKAGEYELGLFEDPYLVDSNRLIDAIGSFRKAGMPDAEITRRIELRASGLVEKGEQSLASYVRKVAASVLLSPKEVTATLGENSNEAAWCRDFIMKNCSDPQLASRAYSWIATVVKAGGADAIAELQKICKFSEPIDNTDILHRLSTVAEVAGSDRQLFLSVLQVASEHWLDAGFFAEKIAQIARNTKSGEAIGKARDLFVRTWEERSAVPTEDLECIARLSEEVPGAIVKIIDIALREHTVLEIDDAVFRCDKIVRVAGAKVGAELMEIAHRAGEDAPWVLRNVEDVAKGGSADAMNRMKLLLELYPAEASGTLAAQVACVYRETKDNGYQKFEEAVSELAKEKTVRQIGRIYSGGFGVETGAIAWRISAVALESGPKAARLAVELALKPPEGVGALEILELLKGTGAHSESEVSNFCKIANNARLMKRINLLAAKEGLENCGKELVWLGTISGSSGLVGRAIKTAEKYGKNSEVLFEILHNMADKPGYNLNKIEGCIDRLNDTQLAKAINDAIVAHGRLWKPLKWRLFVIATGANSVEEAAGLARLIGKQTSEVAEYASTAMNRAINRGGQEVGRIVEFVENGLFEKKMGELRRVLEAREQAHEIHGTFDHFAFMSNVERVFAGAILDSVARGASMHMIGQAKEIFCSREIIGRLEEMYRIHMSLDLETFGRFIERARGLAEIAVFGSKEMVEKAADVITAYYSSNTNFAGVLAFGLAETARENPELFDMRADVFMNPRMIDYMKNRPEESQKKKNEKSEEDMERIFELEKRRPGAVTKLMENPNGILAFGRYRLGTLVGMHDNAVESARSSKPLMVVVMPRADHNGAFYQDAEFIYQMQRDFNVQIVESGSKLDLAKQLSRINKAHGKIAVMMLGGHGTSGTLELGKGKNGEFEIESLLESKSDATRYFEENATLILISCSTGAPGGIAQKGSEKYKIKVHAPEEVAYGFKRCEYIGKDKQGGYLFDVKYNSENPSKTLGIAYAGGKPVADAGAP